MNSDVASRLVFDSFALLAFLQRERGGRQVAVMLRQAETDDVSIALSAINLGEVLYITERRHGIPAATAALGFVEQLPVRIVDADVRRTVQAARFKARYRMSYADAFAASLALEVKATVVTGDPEFEQVEELVPVCWLAG